MRYFSSIRLLLATGLLLLFVNIPAALAASASSPAQSQIDYVTGIVLSVEPMEQTRKISGISGVDKVKIRLTSGPESGLEVESVAYKMDRIDLSIVPKVGDKIVVAVSKNQAQNRYNIADFERANYVYYLIAAFALTLLAVGGRVGLKSLFVICFAIAVILKVMVPLILSYNINIILVTILVSAVISATTQITVSGWNEKTWAAIMGTIGGVIIAGILAYISINVMHLTGFDSEEAIMLKVTYLAAVDFREVLFAGIVLGSLGAVMDVAISIASAQYEIKSSCGNLNMKELFKAGINVGRDVMGTMSNTLILAYLGSSLPLVLLLSAQTNLSLVKLMNLNIIVTEFVRALTGSIGLICSIPLTALITAWLLTRKN